jgi:TM2 domain-containing membrane protein YozV
MSYAYDPYQQQPPIPPDVNSTKVLCGIMGILFGGLGVHRFILGDVSGGIIRIVITLVTCGIGAIIGFIEGIIYLTKTDSDFYWTYMVGKKAWF